MQQLFKYRIMFFVSFSLTLGTLLQSCEEVIDVNLNNADPKLSIDGQINLGGKARVQLSYTSSYFSEEEPQHEENATVIISSSNGLEETLSHQGKGLYTGQTISGQVGITYELKITIDNKIYTGKSKLLTPTEIIKLDYKPFDSFGEEGEYNLEITLKNNPEEENFFLIKYYLNNEEKEDTYNTLSHKYFPKEETIEFSPFSFIFTADDIVTVKAYSIDEATYNYYSELGDIIDQHGGSSTPYNPKSNMGNGVLGFFRAWSYNEQIIQVTEEQ